MTERTVRELQERMKLMEIDCGIPLIDPSDLRVDKILGTIANQLSSHLNQSGQGISSTVYKATWISRGTAVAVKCIDLSNNRLKGEDDFLTVVADEIYSLT